MNRKESPLRKTKLFLMFAGPSLVAFLCVVILPFLYGIYLTMTDWDGFSAQKKFCGNPKLYQSFSGYRILGFYFFDIQICNLL